MTASRAAVTVIMPVHNGERFLSAAIESILAQTFTDFVFVAIDDASTDGTAAILSQFDDRRLHVIRSATRVGPAAARNAGLDIARSPYVAFFDSDDIAAPRRLAIQMGWLREYPRTGLLAARVALIDEHGTPTGPIWGYAGESELIAPSLLFRNPLPMSTVVVDRAVLGNERFDPTLAVASDYDMWNRLGRRTAMTCLSDVLVQYRHHLGNLSHTQRASAGACLDRIALRSLAPMAIVPSPSELSVHRRLRSQQLDGSEAFVREAAAWLVKLDEANAMTAAWPRTAFRRVLAGEWLAICESAVRAQGYRAWGQMGLCPFVGSVVRDRSAWPRLARIPWRSLKSSVRRRWPRRGDASNVAQ